MRSLILILLVTVASFSQTPPIEPGVALEFAQWRSARYSDVRYKLDLRLEKMSPVLKGTIEIRVKVSEPGAVATGALTPIILDWRKLRTFEERSTISNVSLNGKSVTSLSQFDRDGEDYDPDARNLLGSDLKYEWRKQHLIFRDGIVSGENIIKLEFTSPILPSGSAITRYIDKEDGSEYIYSLFVPSDASTAFPVFDQPDLKARFTLQVRRPVDWKAVSNGIATGGPDAGDQVHRFEETKPISTYVFAFAAGPWERVPEGSTIRSRSESVPPAVAGGFFSTASDPPATAGGTDTRRSVDDVSPAGGNPTGREGESIADRGLRIADLQIESANPKSDIRNPKTRPTGPLSASTDQLSTSIYVRKSQLSKFQPHAAETFRLNREAIKYFEEYYDYKFPFPKYDLVLIPEFPFGGMEHAGATFLREASVIFPQEPTKNDLASRATLIFHEAAHQWFGDTVTMRWFDDLWLKEGFANFTAYKAMEKIMPEMNAWKIFYERIKQGAYQTDSTRGTTAIYQPIPNLSAAKSAYGNIVYNKAPAFLRQAEFYLGEDKFRTAVRAFLKKHEFGNAGWEDLVREFESASRQKLTDWAAEWVTQRGLAVYRSRVTTTKEKGYLVATAPRDVLNEGHIWRMKTKGIIVDDFAAPSLNDIPFEVVSGKMEEVSHAFAVGDGPVQLQFFYPNYGDYGYGIFLLDDKSRDYVLKNIQNETDPFLRSMMWGALWDSVREGELDPREYVELVLRVWSPAFTRPTPGGSSTVGNEGKPPKGGAPNRGGTPNGGGNPNASEDESTAAMILNRVSTAMTYYIGDKDRDAVAPRLEAMLLEKMRTAPTMGQRITYYRAFLNVASSETARRILKDMLRQESVPPAIAGGSADLGLRNADRGLASSTNSNPKSEIRDPKSDGTDIRSRPDQIPLKTKDRFDIVTKLASLGDPEAETLLKALEQKETTDDAKRYAYAARAAFPTKESKEKYWNDFVNNKEISESWIEAAFGPFNSVRHADLTLPYLERALKELPNHKRNRKIFFVNGWLGAFIGGQRSEEALAIVNKFLADNPNLDRDLRLKILENVDVIERAVKIRAKYGN